MSNTHRRQRRGQLAVLASILLFLGLTAGTSSALAAPVSGHSQVAPTLAPAPAPAPTLAPDCCASAWYPWGWYSTKAKCTAAGKNVVATVAVALLYKCTYVSNPPASANGRHYHLYILEAT